MYVALCGKEFRDVRDKLDHFIRCDECKKLARITEEAKCKTDVVVEANSA